MNDIETKATLTIALLAAFADGAKDEREREAVRKVAEALGSHGNLDLPALYREVLIGKPDLAQLAAQLTTREARLLAYELAVGVCAADGRQDPAETEFLAKLAAALQLPAAEGKAVDDRAGQIADAAVDQPAPPASADAGASASVSASAGAATGTVLGQSTMPAAEQDRLILNAAITTAALEILPDTLASMAIIPMQLRLVYRIGQSHGYPMDRTQAKDFVATLGVGLTGQYLEQFGRKLLGGLLGGLGGGLGRSLGRQAASSGLAFATTYALGRVAQRYYASGRTLDAAALKDTFTGLLAEARDLAPRYQAEIEQKAGGIDAGKLAQLIKQV